MLLSGDFLFGFGVATVFVVVVHQFVPSARVLVSRWRVKEGEAALVCPECWRAVVDTNLSVLERMVSLATRTDHYVDVSYRPDEPERKWRVIAKVANVKPQVDLFVGSTLEAVLTEVEQRAEQGGAYAEDTTPTLRVVLGGKGGTHESGRATPRG